MNRNNQWSQANLSNLLEKLTEAKQLLEQAAALSAAREGEKVRAMTELQRQKAQEADGGTKRQRCHR